MLFDSPKMQELLQANAGVPLNRLPWITFLALRNEFAEEREYLEASFSRLPAGSKGKLLGLLFAKNESQQVGAWFEIMLHGWLRDNVEGEVIAEPDIEGQRPDFAVEIAGRTVIVEARAFTIDPEARKQNKRYSDIPAILHQIEMPVLVSYRVRSLKYDIEAEDLHDSVTNWLLSNESTKYVFKDAHGNRIDFEVLSHDTGHTKIMLIGDSGFFAVTSDAIKNSIEAKAKRYKDLARKGYPYVIALFLEPSHFSVEEVFAAWVGNETFLVNSAGEVIAHGLDDNGLHLHGGKVWHKSVSGFLVFRRPGRIGYPHIEATYLENPSARNQLSTAAFPAHSHWIVLNRTERSIEMGRQQTCMMPRNKPLDNRE